MYSGYQALTSPRHQIEPILLMKVWVSQPQRCEHGRVAPMTHLAPPPTPTPPTASMPESGGRAGAEVLSVGELLLPLLSCRTRESDPLPQLGSRADSVEVWESRPGEQQSRTGPAPCSSQGVNSPGNAGGFTLMVRVSESWRAGQPRSYPGPEPTFTHL